MAKVSLDIIPATHFFKEQPDLLGAASASVRFQLTLINELIHQLENLESQLRIKINRAMEEKSFALNDNIRLKFSEAYLGLEKFQKQLHLIVQAKHDLYSNLPHYWGKIEDFEFDNSDTDTEVINVLHSVNDALNKIFEAKAECKIIYRNVNYTLKEIGVEEPKNPTKKA